MSRRTGLARALSKLGFCSRSQALTLIEAGRVRVNGQVQVEPEAPVDMARDRIAVDGQPVTAAAKVYLMLNKPRGIVTTAADEQQRATVYSLLTDPELPWVAPVGRLDKASEGLLLMTNDTEWAARITAPDTHLDKTYHVQIDAKPDDAVLDRLRNGVDSQSERLAVKDVRGLRHGHRNAWLEIVLDEGRNRHIRRLLDALDIRVLRLVRVAIGELPLGDLPKGSLRHLTMAEVTRLGAAAGTAPE